MKTQNIMVWMLLVGITVTPLAWAKSKNAAQEPAAQTSDQTASPVTTPSEKLDVSDLENKYWAPKDTDFSVVQNRTYTKEHKLFLSGEFGPDITGGNYLEGNQLALTGNYFFNERYGVQAQFIESFLKTNRSVSDLLSAGGIPDYGIMQNQWSLGFSWVPFYSKMSFLGKKILYFDMAITPTVGMTHYQQITQAGNSGQDALIYGFDVTQYYFFSSHWAFRLDYKNQWWNENIVKDEAGQSPPVGTPLRTNLDHEMIFLFGFTFFFGFGH